MHNNINNVFKIFKSFGGDNMTEKQYGCPWCHGNLEHRDMFSEYELICHLYVCEACNVYIKKYKYE